MLEKEATISTRFQKAPRRAIHLLQRRINPGRMYQQNNDRISYEELLAFDQNIDQLRSFIDHLHREMSSGGRLRILLAR